ncbi:hypothetical protein [Pseudomonas cichorii]|uniref:Uncharacterized protein n=1 Tax=Pseudomonas cichorii TaxID=36746 RepID=A0ABQ1DQU9_PSECI|nr:hypothetical protein [Pseudomonas cichorii]AHF70303.1 hypothetical protein PCH70_51500 [Pseudomonas cichorii JBC1]QVE17169.1 hypothetical protein KGD89_25730 [Pseudomonas cichorii]SDO57033.1 hypothetical protein SAMN05216599_110119 [Pseudomonas cichorii]GFM77898.1 hypothetical protein PSCICM_37170 [Pseudomonas cichorii]GFM93411.1 hypothetical protein PSCICP_33830 [Pseudomonas cichorii]
MRTLAWLLLGCLAGHASAQEEPVFLTGIGTHLMNFDHQLRQPLNLAGQAGFNAVRDDIFWSTAEPSPNQWRIIPQWRNYLNMASDLNLSRTAILGYSTSFHGNAKPRTPEVTAAFLKYVDYVSRQLGNKVSFYEVWNEWDLDGPKDRKLSLDYADLVTSTVPVIRKNTRDVNGTQAKILAGAITRDGMNGGFADGLIESGVLDLVDGLSLHPYAHCSATNGNTPEAWVRWMTRYEQDIRTRVGRAVPLYLTEMGWPSHQGPCGKSEVTQAVYMARIFFLARTIPNVKGLWWYDLFNDGPNRYDQEHNFGVLNEDLSPKPAYAMMQAIAPIISSYTYDAQASTLSDSTYLLYFDKDDERVLVAWAIGQPTDEQIVSERPMSGPVRLTDTINPEQGRIDSKQSWQCQASRCSTSVRLTNFPKIISLSRNH